MAQDQKRRLSMFFIALLMLLQLNLSTEHVSKPCLFCGAEHIINKSGIFKNFPNYLCDPVNFNEPVQTRVNPAQTWSIDVFVPKPKMKLRFQTECPKNKSKFICDVDRELERIAPDFYCECTAIEPAADVLKYKSWHVRSPTFLLKTFWVHLQGNGCEAASVYIIENQLTIKGQKYILVNDMCRICLESAQMNILGCSPLHMCCDTCLQNVKGRSKSKCPWCRQPITLNLMMQIWNKVKPVARIIFIYAVIAYDYGDRMFKELIDLITGIFAGPAYGYFSRQRVIRYLIEFALITEPFIMLMNYYDLDSLTYMYVACFLNAGVQYAFEPPVSGLSGAQLFLIMNHMEITKPITSFPKSTDSIIVVILRSIPFWTFYVNTWVHKANIVLIFAALTAFILSRMQKIGKLGAICAVSLIIGFLAVEIPQHYLIKYTLPYGWITFNSAVFEKSLLLGAAIYMWHELFLPFWNQL